MNIQASRLNKKKNKNSFYSNLFPKGSTSRKIMSYGGIPLIVLFVLYFVINSIVMPIITRHGEEFALPDFTDQRLTEAQLGINDLNLAYEISSEEYSPGKEKGIVLNQFPIAGTDVKEGRIIKFVVSLGQKNIIIPDLSGLSVRQAMLNLETAGLVLGEIAWAFSDTLPEKVVVFSYPNKGIEIPMGTSVNLMVNRGRASNFTFMPKVVGMTLDEASALIEDKVLKVGIVTYRTDENYLPETVLEQSEPEGTELDIRTEIDLVVSTTE
ncbi:MAG TPA: PASTA domain-containing protein [candidate division Zixibacteria bacterium]|nr:PASTA domain-containing protein [candidate division Zixibacteria bacterium]